MISIKQDSYLGRLYLVFIQQKQEFIQRSFSKNLKKFI